MLIECFHNATNSKPSATEVGHRYDHPEVRSYFPFDCWNSTPQMNQPNWKRLAHRHVEPPATDPICKLAWTIYICDRNEGKLKLKWNGKLNQNSQYYEIQNSPVLQIFFTLSHEFVFCVACFEWILSLRQWCDIGHVGNYFPDFIHFLQFVTINCWKRMKIY